MVKLDPTQPVIYSFDKHGDLVSWPLALPLIDEYDQPIGLAMYRELDADTNTLYYWCAELDQLFKIKPKHKKEVHQ